MFAHNFFSVMKVLYSAAKLLCKISVASIRCVCISILYRVQVAQRENNFQLFGQLLILSLSIVLSVILSLCSQQ